MLIGSFLRVSCDRVVNLAQVTNVYIHRFNYDDEYTLIVEFSCWDDANRAVLQDWYEFSSPEAQALMSHFGLSPEVEEFEVQE